MVVVRGILDPAVRPEKPFVLPPELDMGFLKVDDLSLDLEREVARLRAAEQCGPSVRPATGSTRP